MMDHTLIARIFPHFLQAAWVTVSISGLALLIGLACAALAASARLSRLSAPRFLGALYVSVFRGTPCLIQIFILYFGGPQIGLQLNPFAAGAIGLGVNIGAYMGEVVRGAILAVDRGQTEAARTLGFSRWQAMRHFVLPQAARLMVRPLGVNAIALVKGSALVSTISVIELTYTAQRYIGATYKPFEICAIAGVIYMVVVYGMSRAIDVIDARYAVR